MSDFGARFFFMLFFLLLTCISFSLLGFIIGIVSDNFEQLNIAPMLIITPLVFLGGSFYTIDMLPPFWQNFALLNPIVYLISGFRWAFFGIGDVLGFGVFGLRFWVRFRGCGVCCC